MKLILRFPPSFKRFLHRFRRYRSHRALLRMQRAKVLEMPRTLIPYCRWCRTWVDVRLMNDGPICGLCQQTINAQHDGDSLQSLVRAVDYRETLLEEFRR